MIRLERRKPTRPTRPALRGLGMDYYDLLNQAGRENCDPHDSGCVMRNEQRTDAVSAVWQQYMSSPNGAPAGTVIQVQTDNSPAALAQYMGNQVVTSQTITVDTPTAPPVTYTDKQLQSGAVLPDAHSPTNTPAIVGPAPAGAVPIQGVPWYLMATNTPAPAAATVYTPRVSFSNTSGTSNTQLHTGDYWKITITGGAPNAAVVVSGGKNGATDRTPTGTTDASGNFSLAGQVGTAEIGVWSEQWTVGATAAGTLTFSVSPAPLPAQSTDTTSSTTPADQLPGSTSTTTTTTTSAAGILATIESQPWYILAGAGIAGVLLLKSMFGHGGRR